MLRKLAAAGAALYVVVLAQTAGAATPLDPLFASSGVTIDDQSKQSFTVTDLALAANGSTIASQMTYGATPTVSVAGAQAGGYVLGSTRLDYYGMVSGPEGMVDLVVRSKGSAFVGLPFEDQTSGLWSYTAFAQVGVFQFGSPVNINGDVRVHSDSTTETIEDGEGGVTEFVTHFMGAQGSLANFATGEYFLDAIDFTFSADGDGLTVNWDFAIPISVQANKAFGVLIGSSFEGLYTGDGAPAAPLQFSAMADPEFGISPDFPDASLYSLSFSTAAVPEPGTWLLLIAGFAVAGAGLRRARGWPRADQKIATLAGLTRGWL